MDDNTNTYMNRVLLTISVILGMLIIMFSLSSCSINRGLSKEQIDTRNKITYELDHLYLEYSYERDSLINEFYMIKPKK